MNSLATDSLRYRYVGCGRMSKMETDCYYKSWLLWCPTWFNPEDSVLAPRWAVLGWWLWCMIALVQFFNTVSLVDEEDACFPLKVTDKRWTRDGYYFYE